MSRCIRKFDVNLQSMETEFTHIYTVEYMEENIKRVARIKAKNIMVICDFLRDNQIVAWTDDILSVKLEEW